MTIEKMFQIRNAVKILANVSDSEWAELILMLEVGKKVNPTESVTDETPTEDQKAIEKKLYDLLKELGVRSNILGYKYVQKAILLVIDNPNLMKDIVNGLYSAVAREFDTKPKAVERSIRHAVETVYENGNTEKLEEIFGLYSKRPSSSAFIAGMVEYLHYN